MSHVTRLVSLGVVAILIIFLGITFFHVVSPFLFSLFLAGIIAMLAQPIQAYFERKTQGRGRLSAGLTAGTILLGISTPVIIGVGLATVQISLFVNGMLTDYDIAEFAQQARQELHVDNIMDRLPDFVTENIDETKLQEKFRDSVEKGLNLLVGKTAGYAGEVVGLLGSVVFAVVQLLAFVIALYYFLADGPGLIAAAEALIPVDLAYQRELRKKFHTVVRAVVLATFLSAIGQGLATGVVLWFFGFKQFVILVILAMFGSMIPFFGTALVWGPCAIMLALNGAWVSAILLAVIGLGVIGTLDNLIRMYVLQNDTQLHPLLAFVCVLGGVQVMGIWGVFIAPIVAAILHALLVIFNTEITELSNERIVEKLPPGSTENPPEGERDNSPDAANSQPEEPIDEPPEESAASE